MNKNILIVGNGYVGSNLALKLYELNYNVTILTNHTENQIPGVTYMHVNVDDLYLMSNTFTNIFVLNGYSRLTSIKKYSDVINSKYYVLSKILEYAIQNDSKIFYLTTSLCLSELTSTNNFYSYIHTVCIDLIKQYYHWNTLNYHICYAHNIYGNLTSFEKKNKMFVDNLIEAIQTKNSITLYNGGNQKKVFTHIYDVINYMILSLDIENNKEVNLVKNPKIYSIKELTELCNVKYNTVDDSLYTMIDPVITKLDVIENWIETIDIKQWLTNINS